MRAIKIVMFTVFILIGVFYSCSDKSKGGTSSEEMEKAAEIKMSAFLLKPDSLRTEEEKVLAEKLEAVIYEEVQMINNRFVMSIGKKEWKERGLSEQLYDILIKEINHNNNVLDTLSSPIPELLEQGFNDSRDEYLSRKKSQQLEPQNQ